jgi:hypothetical protein
MATKTQIAQWKEELKTSFPNCDPYFINLICDIYETNPEYIKKVVKKKFKKVEVETPKEIIGSVNVIKDPSPEIIDKYFKAPIVIKDDDQVEA